MGRPTGTCFLRWGNVMISLSLNGKTVQLSATPDTPLLWALRDEFGCGIAVCGA
jgi:isoquinoline 1-oxidoreductase alpha subunit